MSTPFASPPIPTARRVLTGWGRTASSACEVARPRSGTDVDALLADAAARGRRVLARGLGRSYGDAAQCAGGVVVDATALDAVEDTDRDDGVLRAGAGVSIDAMMRALVPRGWFVPVTPGTRFVTLGGAIAADIHGKNHHADGSFGAHVERLSLATPTGRMEVSPQADPELFWATVGGIGLTGIVVEATVRLLPVETAYMVVDIERAISLDDCMDRLARTDTQYRYSVAWIDCLARGARLGRAVLTRGDHARLADLPAQRRSRALRFEPRMRAAVPVTPPPGLLNPFTVAAFNAAWFRAARVGHGAIHPMAGFFHPLDGVGDWNRLYGPRGFLQYQFVVPVGAEDALRAVLERLSAARVASFLAVLKRFGPSSPGPLSFPAEGWTLALDIPVGAPGLGSLLDALDETVAEAGGRVYLAKDGRLRPDLVAAMYPRLAQWRTVRARVDPDGVFTSDLARRLGVIEHVVVAPRARARRARR